MFRLFSSDVEILAQQCFDNPIIEDSFEVKGALEGGGTSSRRVVVSSTNLTAWAKPARLDPMGNQCIGSEKICSDLAFKIGLPIAPVQIVKNHGVADFPELVCLSYAASPQPRPWNQNILTTTQIEMLRPVLGAMFAFSAWVADSDHNWNEGNALFEILPDDTVRSVFIDFSFALMKHWDPPNPPTQCHTSSRLGPNQNVDLDGLEAGIVAIESLAESDIKAIFDKLPEECLARDKRPSYVRALDVRRAELRKLLGVS